MDFRLFWNLLLMLSYALAFNEISKKKPVKVLFFRFLFSLFIFFWFEFLSCLKYICCSALAFSRFCPTNREGGVCCEIATKCVAPLSLLAFTSLSLEASLTLSLFFIFLIFIIFLFRVKVVDRVVLRLRLFNRKERKN